MTPRLPPAAAAVLTLLMLTLPPAFAADDLVKRLLDLQLRKGIITQQDYDEFMALTLAPDGTAAKDAGAKPAAPAASEPRPATTQPSLAQASAVPAAAKDASGSGVALLSTDTLKVELFGTVDVSLGYTSRSLVPSGEMPTSIGPWVSGGVRYPASGGYPSSNMSAQTGLFNSSLSTSSWGLRASRDMGGGQKAFILLDSAFNPVTGQFTDQSHNQASNSRYPTTAYSTSSLNGQLFSKEAYIGVSDREYGRLSFGRNNNFILDTMNRYSPVQKAGLFTPYGNGVYGGGGGISEHARIDNSIKYTHKSGNVNVGLMVGLGGTGGLKQGAQGTAALIGYETQRYGVQLVYQEFKDLLKTSTDATTPNTINLTAYDQRALLLAGKYALSERTRLLAGLQQTRLLSPTADVNIPFISSLYGETVNKSSAYSGDTVRLNTYHLGVDHDLTEKLYLGAAYTFIEMPKYDYLSGASQAHYLGGRLDALSGLAIYKLYTGTDIYGGMVYTHYSGDAFKDTASTIYARHIFTAAAGLRFKF